MAQISIFLTEYANGISVLFYGFTLILLLVTLHRIRRIEKQIQEITGNINRIADQTEQRQEIQKEIAVPDQEQPKHAAGEENPAELIDAVLGEVFRNPA